MDPLRLAPSLPAGMIPVMFCATMLYATSLRR